MMTLYGPNGKPIEPPPTEESEIEKRLTEAERRMAEALAAQIFDNPEERVWRFRETCGLPGATILGLASLKP